MEHEYEFVARVSEDTSEDVSFMRHYLPLPRDVGEALTARAVTHVMGRVEMTSFRRALHRDARGGVYLKFGRSWLRGAGLSVGEEVVVAMSVDPDPSRVHVPPVLADLLSWEPDAAEAWEALTPGRRKTLAYQVDRAKRPETRERRARELVEELMRQVEAQT